jgi:hypothetical protein
MNCNIPDKDILLFNHNFRINIDYYNYIINIINDFISNNSFRYIFNVSSYCWTIEYGTTPIEYTINDYYIKNIIRNKKLLAKDVAIIASRKFCNNIVNEYNINQYLYKYNNLYKWCKIDIWLSNDKAENNLVIELNRILGCRVTFNYIKKQLFNYINNYFWNKRVNLLKLKESTLNEYNIMLSYIHDEYCLREICQYI